MDNLNNSFKISSNVKSLLVPAITITIVILMLVLLVPQSITNINKKMQEYKSAQAQENVLSEKVEALRKINLSLLDPEDVTVIGLPSKNPAIWLVSHVRKLTEEYEIEIAKISVDRAGEKNEIKDSSISFEFESKEYPKLLSFIEDLTKILPVSSLNGVSIKRKLDRETVEIYEGSVKISFYWSDFPEKLPPLTAPVNELTAADMNLIGAISGYRKPAFIELAPTEPRDRPQPFN